jgi:hypothetical protein
MTIKLRHIDGIYDALEILIHSNSIPPGDYRHEIEIDGVSRSVPSNTWTEIWRASRPPQASLPIAELLRSHHDRLTVLEAGRNAPGYPPDVEGMITMPPGLAQKLADTSPVLHVEREALLYVGKTSPSGWLLIKADR